MSAHGDKGNAIGEHDRAFCRKLASVEMESSARQKGILYLRQKQRTIAAAEALFRGLDT